MTADLSEMLGLGLFGDPVNATEPLAELASVRVPEGIEAEAKETRLNLTLVGVAAAADDGQGIAVIEAKGSQANFSVGDKLPAPGDVTLAKVLARRVVIDNNGQYELLKLFDQDDLQQMLASPPVAIAKSTGDALPGSVEASQPRTLADDSTSAGDSKTVRGDADLAARFRDQLYDDPQSLAEVVRISAVRDASGLAGYRVTPGSNAQQFKALGFVSGDLVTAVNGMSLTEPANAVKLYQMMREATEAVFDVQRGESSVTIAVSLNEG